MGWAELRGGCFWQTKELHMMNDYYLTRELAKQHGWPFWLLNHLFDAGYLDRERCPVRGGRRFIPADYLPELIEAVRERGYPSRKADIEAGTTK